MLSPLEPRTGNSADFVQGCTLSTHSSVWHTAGTQECCFARKLIFYHPITFLKTFFSPENFWSFFQQGKEEKCQFLCTFNSTEYFYFKNQQFDERRKTAFLWLSVRFTFLKCLLRSWWSSGWDSTFRIQGAWVWSLLRESRSHTKSCN